MKGMQKNESLVQPIDLLTIKICMILLKYWFQLLAFCM